MSILFIHFVHRYAYFATRLKDPRFSVEEEWRIVHMRSIYDGPLGDLKFRTVNGLLVPYIELPLWLAGDPRMAQPHEGNFTVKSITFGPSLHPQLAKRSLELLINSMEILNQFDIDIRGSNIPVKI